MINDDRHAIDRLETAANQIIKLWMEDVLTYRTNWTDDLRRCSDAIGELREAVEQVTRERLDRP